MVHGHEEKTNQKRGFFKQKRRNKNPQNNTGTGGLKRKNHKKSSKPLTKPINLKHPKPLDKNSLVFQEQLDLTELWLEDNFPHLFAADEYIPLDKNILRDLKDDYKNNALRKNYPKGLVIKAAISRYINSYGYLERLKQGAIRYNLKGNPCGTVGQEEEAAAQKILATL